MTSTNLLDSIGAATLAGRHFARAALAACQDLATVSRALRDSYLTALATERTAEEAASELGGTVRQQRMVRRAHRRYAQACAVERAAFRVAVIKG